MSLNPADRPLAGIKVLDLTSLLPGPLATRMLAAAGMQQGWSLRRRRLAAA